MAVELRNLSWSAVAATSCILILIVAAFVIAPNLQQRPEPPVQQQAVAKQASVTRNPELQAQIEQGSFGLLGEDGKESLPFFPYESISLERTGCFGPCPIYTVTFYKDGRATLVTRNLQENQKSYTGRASLWAFARLTQLVDLAKDAAKQEYYGGQWTDDYTASIQVQSNDGIWKVSDYGQVAPPEVWALETLLHMYREKIEWKLISEVPRNQS